MRYNHEQIRRLQAALEKAVTEARDAWAAVEAAQRGHGNITSSWAAYNAAYKKEKILRARLKRAKKGLPVQQDGRTEAEKKAERAARRARQLATSRAGQLKSSAASAAPLPRGFTAPPSEKSLRRRRRKLEKARKRKK